MGHTSKLMGTSEQQPDQGTAGLRVSHKEARKGWGWRETNWAWKGRDRLIVDSDLNKGEHSVRRGKSA